MTIEQNANSIQIDGTHYISAYQHWDFVNDFKLGYFEGNISKYLTRWKKKNGTRDLLKAQHYGLKLKELFMVKNRIRQSMLNAFGVAHFCQINELDVETTDLMQRFLRFNSLREINEALDRLTMLIANNSSVDKGI